MERLETEVGKGGPRSQNSHCFKRRASLSLMCQRALGKQKAYERNFVFFISFCYLFCFTEEIHITFLRSQRITFTKAQKRFYLPNERNRMVQTDQFSYVLKTLYLSHHVHLTKSSTERWNSMCIYRYTHTHTHIYKMLYVIKCYKMNILYIYICIQYIPEP